LARLFDSSKAAPRNPFGAIVALISGGAGAAADGDRVAWHVLNAQDESRAFDLYGRLFGWTPIELLAVGSRGERVQLFSWDRTKGAAGATTNGAGLPHIHPQVALLSYRELRGIAQEIREWGGLTLPTRRTSACGL
jgi:predicted enzyme related to lactoylglutathione lyase